MRLSNTVRAHRFLPCVEPLEQRALLSARFAPAMITSGGVPDQPFSLAVGDFSLDGKLDVAVGNANGTGGLGLLVGNGKSGFVAGNGSPLFAGQSIPAVVAADFNGDGFMDLAVANDNGHKVSVVLNPGPGGGAAVISNFNLAAQNLPDVLAVGDFNGDGLPDLILGDRGNNTLSFLLNKGDGSLTLSKFVNTGNPVTAIGVGDFNGDGNLDFAAVEPKNGEVDVVYGDGHGMYLNRKGFFAASVLPAGVQPSAVAVGDFNGDGSPDLAVVDPAKPQVYVLLNDGTGNFLPAKVVSTGASSLGIAAADFNGDGKLDLAVTDMAHGNVIVLEGDGTGNFVPAKTSPFATGSSPTSVAVGDFNGDGAPDLLVADTGGSNLALLFNEGATATTLAASAAATTANQPLTLTATVSATFPKAGVPTGSVTFLDGGTVLGAAPLDAGGHASLSALLPAAGSHHLIAAYNGDGTFFPSKSAALAEVVASAPPTATGVQVVSGGRSGKVQGLVVTFNEALDPASAQDLAHYALVIPARGNGKKHKPRIVPILAAVYHPTTHAVTLSLGKLKNTDSQGMLEVMGVADPAEEVLAGADLFVLNLRPSRKH
jgi:hypothetical protein